MTPQSTEPVRRKMLVVDDDLEYRHILSRLFEKEFVVLSAGSAEEALSTMVQGPFDIVILDMHMPRAASSFSNDLSGGIECLKAVHQRDPHTPVIMFTAYPSFEGAGEAYRLGAEAYVSKSSSITGEGGPDSLVQAVRAAMSKTKQRSKWQVPLEFPGEMTPDHVLIETTPAFIHKLTSQFALLSRIVRDFDGVFAGLSSEAPEELLAWKNKLATALASTHYLLERFRNIIGRHPGVLRPVEIYRVLRDVQDHFSTVFPSRINLRETTLPCEVMGDYELLWHLFENLIRNGLEATEHRHDGRVIVASEIDLEHSTVRITVRDNGSGIPPEALQRLFALNYSTKPGGLGVGLYLAKRAASIHGGSIACASDCNTGTEFTVSLPVNTEDKRNLP